MSQVPFDVPVRYPSYRLANQLRREMQRREEREEEIATLAEFEAGLRRSIPTATPRFVGPEIRQLPEPRVSTPLDLFGPRSPFPGLGTSGADTLGPLETLEAVVSPSEFVSGKLTDFANRLPGIGQDRAMGPTGGGFAATVERERSRSLAHQVAGGVVDPLNAVPVVGFGPSPAVIRRTVEGVVEGVLSATTPIAKAAADVAPPILHTGPPAVKAALDRASQFLTIDAPGFTGRVLDRIPGISQAQAYLRPANKIPPHIETAYVAEGGETARFSTKMFESRPALFNGIDGLFGKGAAEGADTGITFTGAAADRVGIVGTVLDIAQRPHLYDLTDVQRRFLATWQERNHGLMQELIEQYGANVGEFVPAEGAVFLSNVDIAEDVLKAMDASRFRAATTGRGKTRVFETAADRMKFDPKFVPETNLRSLQSAMDTWKATVAGRQVFKQGVGGKTLIELMDELHPRLRKAKNDLTAKVRSLKDRVETAAQQVRNLTAEAGRVGTQARSARQRAQPFLDRVEELGEEWGPELSTLSGQARELLLRASELERRGVGLAERIGARGAKAKSLVTELSEVAPQLEKLRRGYEAANLRGNQLVQDGVFRYFPAAEAKVIRELRKANESHAVRIVEEIRGTAFAGDLSPLLGIQIPLGALFNPKQAVQQLLGGIKASVKNKDALAIFRDQNFAKVIGEDLPGWMDFSFYSGIPAKSGDLGEFAGGLLRHIPGFTKANEAMFSIVLRQSKALYDDQLRVLAQMGYTGEYAKALAADMATKVYPMWNPRRLGLSSARAAAIRSAPTSISFMTRPAALMGEAATGFAKMVTGQARTPAETLAVRLALSVTASWMGLTVTSAVVNAQIRGLDPWQAAKDAVNPVGGKFGSLIIPGTGLRIPLGGPLRGMIKAIVPREVDWSPVPVPFAGIGNYFRNRVTPAISTQIRLIQNRDFQGGVIYKGALPEKILRIALFEFEGMLPLTAGSVIGGIRRQLDAGEIGREAIGQFAGVNLGDETPFQERNIEVIRWAEANDVTTREGKTPQTFFELEPHQRKAFNEVQPQVVESIKAETKRQADQGIERAVRRQRSEDLKEEARLNQERDDDAFARFQQGDSSGISGGQWRKNRTTRAATLNSKREELFEGVDARDPETPVDFYFAKLDELEVQNNGVMTPQAWEDLDRWVAEQSTEDQAFIEVNTRLNAMTPAVQQYYNDLEILRPYFDLDKAMLELDDPRIFASEEEREFWRLYIESDDSQVKRLAGRFLVKRQLDILRQLRELARGIPEIKQLLFKYEFSTTPGDVSQLEGTIGRLGELLEPVGAR